jgi:4-alpha-glucanotransferase
MKLTFRLRYHTNYGQNLFLTGSHPLLGDGRIEDAVPLHYLDPEHWQVTIPLSGDAAPTTRITYEYILREADGVLKRDCGKGRGINPAAFAQEEMLMIDAWNETGAFGNAFLTEPFQRVLFREIYAEVPAATPSVPTHTFKVKAPLLTRNQTLCLLGDVEILGRWNTTHPVLLRRTEGDPNLSVQLDLRQQSFPMAYKYGVYDLANQAFVRFEEGENRTLDDSVAPGKHTVVNDGFVALPADTWKGAGVAIPVFSLRTENSFGVGEFTDLKLLGDWGRQTGLKLIQLLPINDSIASHTWMDSFPYSAISAFALHPLYLNLSRMTEPGNRHLLEALEPERQRLNALDALDYDTVIKAKLDFIRQIYPLQREKTFQSAEYLSFFGSNQDWLVPHAAFCHLRDKHGTSDFNAWPEHNHYQAEEIAKLGAEGSPARDEIALNYFIQYHLHLQLDEAAKQARADGLIVKGDIAIGVNRCGVDAWQNPGLYDMDLQAGAPPDAFAEKGQNWGFPTYNWERMKGDGYAWWKRRFEQMNRYFDAFRIDHILGFFRIWSIPSHAVEGILGYFVPAIPVAIDEFKSRGIGFERGRYTRPYITDEILEELFGAKSGFVKSEFLNPGGGGTWSLKPEFSTQRQVERHFASLEPCASDETIKLGLYDLISNVILFEVEESQGREFHFRYRIEHTSSFKSLPEQTRDQLKDLYIDYFWRRQDDYWRKQALEKLPALQSATNMLVCGEDLGMVPGCVPGVMRELGLLRLEVQRMPKAMGRDFSRPAEAPYLSVVTPSTHDMSTIRGWWEENRKQTQKFYHVELERSGHPPRHCEPWINKAIVRQHLASPAMWSIFQLQDLLGMDAGLRRADPHAERINIPGKLEACWRYRMHVTLEHLLQAEGFNKELKGMVRQAGR